MTLIQRALRLIGVQDNHKQRMCMKPNRIGQFYLEGPMVNPSGPMTFADRYAFLRRKCSEDLLNRLIREEADRTDTTFIDLLRSFDLL